MDSHYLGLGMDLGTPYLLAMSRKIRSMYLNEAKGGEKIGWSGNMEESEG